MKRVYYQVIKNRLQEPRKFIQVIYGPRQVGKTTLMKQVLRDLDMPCLFETADDIIGADNTWLRKLWDKARFFAKQNNGADVVLVIDEIQKIHNWSETVKKEWDSDSFNDVQLKVAVLGSSSLLIRQGLTESLAGRFETIHIPHWSFVEMQEAFGLTLEQFVWFGGYPGPIHLSGDESRWKRYVRESLIETSVSKDVLMMTRVDKPALLRRLFEIGSSYSSQILSLTKIQAELMEKGNITTLSNYLGLLSSAGLLCGLEKYSGEIIRKRSSRPKFQVFNNALISSQSAYDFKKAIADSKLWGRVVESSVGAHLLNLSSELDYNLYYWNENSKEVDFVIEKGEKVVAIEVKSGKDSTNPGMAEFDLRFHPKSMYTVGTDGIPLEDFFRTNPLDLF